MCGAFGLLGAGAPLALQLAAAGSAAGQSAPDYKALVCVFLDGGNVWEGEWDFNLGDMRYDVGPGLRYNTPVGPFRFDIGYQLNPIPGLAPEGEVLTRRFRLHFSIGQAF